jgi:ABC-2 type transport system ATP-binding protein
MPTVSVAHISKRFGNTEAVKDVSFEVSPGEIFGLLGPNGSGKTTIIRIILDIYRQDSGSVSFLNGPMNEAKKNHVGYLPEERGLYQDVQLERCLNYLATLKGMTQDQIAAKLPGYLEKFDLSKQKKNKIKELSKGMQQKAQLIATLIHDPDVIIIDEPFSALDPLNTQLVKDILREQREAGKTIIMSTHQMNLVETLCDRIVLIDKGQVLLYGDLREIRDQFTTNAILINSDANLPQNMPGIASVEENGLTLKLTPKDGITPQDLLNTLVKHGVNLKSFEVATPSLDEVFIRVVNEGKTQNE